MGIIDSEIGNGIGHKGTKGRRVRRYVASIDIAISM
jgi:hypothetical protein